MDIDVMGKHIHGLLAFKDKIEEMIKGSDDDVAKATDQLDELLAFKASFEKALPDFEKAISDVSVVVDDLGKLKADLAPVLAWVAEQQTAIEAAKAADQQKAGDAAKAHQLHGASEAARVAAGADAKPAETEAKPEAPQGEEAPAPRSESEQSSA